MGWAAGQNPPAENDIQLIADLNAFRPGGQRR